MYNKHTYINDTLDDIECYKAVLDRRLKQFPRGFWDKPWSKQTAASITRYLLEERLKYTEEDIKTKVDGKLFRDNKLQGMNMIVFNGSTYAIINNAYPNRFKPWELSRVPQSFWDDENNIKQVVRWLVETKLDSNRDRIRKEFTNEFMTRNRVATLNKYGVYNLLNMVYPNEFKPWELGTVAHSFWNNKQNTIESVKWIVEVKLGNTKERVCKELNADFLRQNGLTELLKCGIYNLLNLVYPNEYNPWELSGVTKGFWKDENNIKSAVRWLVATKLDNNEDRVKNEFNQKLLRDNGLGMLTIVGIQNLLDMTYPNKFKK